MYSSQDNSTVPHGVPVASPWKDVQWPKVCALRAQLDAVLGDIPSLEQSTLDALRELGPLLPCFRLDDQGALYLRLEDSGYVHCVAEDIASRLEVERWLDQGSSVAIPALPHARGLFHLKDCAWCRCTMFRHRAPSALVVDESLLSSPCTWMVYEAGLRATALGQSPVEALTVEVAVAEWLAETERFSDAPDLLARRRTRLLELSH